MSEQADFVCVYRAPAAITPDRTDVRCSSPGESVATPKSRSLATTTGATGWSAVCRRLQFDVDDHQRSPRHSPETVMDYVERLYDDKVARWNMDFRTLTPLNGGRWRWTRVQTATSKSVRADDRRLTASRNVVTKNHRRQINGEFGYSHRRPKSASFCVARLGLSAKF